MTVSNKYLRQLEQERSQDLATLSQLSRDLDAHLKGKQVVKTKVPAKYVGVTKAQGDAQYQTNLTRFGAKNLGRAFGVNMSLMELHNDTRAELEAMLGSGAALRNYVDICTEVIIHIVGQAAARMTAAQSSELKSGYDKYMSELRTTSKVTEALKALNGSTGLFKSRVFNYLAPINRSYVEALQAINLSKIEARGDMVKYIANANAQLAVSRYIAKKRPSEDVLLPGSIVPTAVRGVGRTISSMGLTTPEEKDVVSAFAANPSKDVVATYNYYRAAVTSEIDMGTGIRVGDVEASLKAAQTALNNAASAMNLTGIAKGEARIFSDAFRTIAKRVGSHKVKDLSQDAIELDIADIFDLIGAYDGIGTSSLTKATSTIYQTNTDPTVQTNIENILKAMPSAYTTIGSGFAQQDIAFLDAQDAIRPDDVNSIETKKPTLAAVRNNVSLAICSLLDAINELGVGVSLGVSKIDQVVRAEPQVTGPFKKLVEQQINAAQARFLNMASNTAVDTTIYNAAINEMYTQILGVTSVSGTPIETANSGLNQDAKDWDITDARFEQIADGRVPSLSSRSSDGRTIEQVLVDFVDRQFASSATRGRANVRRSTRDAVLQSAQLFCDVLDGVRLQAEYSGMVVRQNPMGDLSGLQIAGVTTGSLVGTHALSALTNRFVQPKHGTVMSHVADLAPSLAVIGTGAYLAHSKGQKDLGYSLAGGAAGHLALRYLMKHVPALRFSDNIAAKVLQAPTSGLAHLLGDTTMGVSGLTPADGQAHKNDLGAYICGLVCTNSKDALNYIAIQLWQSGVTVDDMSFEDDGGGALFALGEPKTVARSAIKDDAVACQQIGMICMALAFLKCLCDNGLDISVGKDSKNGCGYAGEISEAILKECIACATECCKACAGIVGCDASLMTGESSASAVTVEGVLAKMAQIKELNNALPEEQGMAAGLAMLAKIGQAIGEEQASLVMQQKLDQLTPADLAKVDAIISAAIAASAKPNPMHMGGFILEPGYNMDVYSGEDQVSYLQPAPQMTSQAGFTQLEDAIARSEQLGPQEKMLEGIGDLQDVAIIRATPADARMVENMGAGVSLGQSRSNPSKELVALEVEGDNGLMTVTPARQHSVPQGALNHAKIGHAPNIDVSPHGLFNRGAFNPMYGR